MPPHPLTHHEIFALVGPFSRRGHHVDVAATDRLQRRLVFQSRDRSADAPEMGALRETLELHSTGSGTLRLSRSLLRDGGLVAKLEMHGADPAQLLRCIDSIPPQRQFLAGIGFIAACDYELAAAGPLAAYDDASAAAGPLAAHDDASAATGPLAAYDDASAAAGRLAAHDNASAAGGTFAAHVVPLAAHDDASAAGGTFAAHVVPLAAHDDASAAGGTLAAHDDALAASGPLAAYDDASAATISLAAAGPVAAAHNFALAAARTDAAPLAPPQTTLIWKRGFAKLRHLTLEISAPTVRGERAEIVLAAEAAQPLSLPRDLLAVLGWHWSTLRDSGTGWRSKLRFAGREPARSRHAERQFERAVLHLAATLAEAPGLFHARWMAARWRVYARCAMPLAACVALIAATAALPRAHLTEHSALRMLIFNMPPLLMGLYFCLREIPRIEIPPLPRPLRDSAWPFPSTNPNLGTNPSLGANPSLSANPNLGTNPSLGANPNLGTNPSLGANPSLSANPNLGTNPSLGANPNLGTNPSSGTRPDLSANPNLIANPDPSANPKPNLSANPS